MTRLIKKYKNRRLYDTEISRYITIEELQHYILENIEFEVQDSSTKEDLTNATLLQILVESQTGSAKFLSPLMLRQLIKLANHPMNQSFMVVVEQMLANLEVQSQAKNYFSDFESLKDVWSKQMDQFFKNSGQ